LIKLHEDEIREQISNFVKKYIGIKYSEIKFELGVSLNSASFMVLDFSEIDLI